MVRDRLADLQSGMANDGRFDEVELGERQPSGGSSIITGIRTALSHDEFSGRVRDATAALDALNSDVQRLRTKQAHILSLPVVEARHKEELEECMARIVSATRALRPRLASIEDELRRNEGGTLPRGVELRIRRNQCDLLKKRMQDIIQQFNESELDYKARVAKRVRNRLELAGEQLDEQDIERMLSSHSTQVFYREVNPLTVAGRMALDDAAARHEEILELERNLAILNEMFTDVYSMVHSQGEMVDSIQKNVDSAVVHTEEARQNTKKAQYYKTSAQRKKLFCVLAIVVLILILVVVAIILGVVLSGKK